MRGGSKLSPTLVRLLTAATGLVCAAALQAEDFAAKLLVESGQVSVLKDGVPAALFSGNQIQPQQIVVTGPDSYAKFQLADGSTFEVFANSRVTFRAPGSGITELLRVWIGRVLVFIDHSRGPNYKDVNTPTAIISVRGTVFDVTVEDADGTTFVTVWDGLVGVRNVTSYGDAVLLHPGESIRVFPNTPLAMKQIDPNSVLRGVLRAAQEAAYRIAYGRQTGGGGPIGTGGGTTTGTSGDTHGKCGGSTGTSGSSSPTGAPPSGPPGGGGFFDARDTVSGDPAAAVVFASPRARLKTWFPPFVRFFR